MTNRYAIGFCACLTLGTAALAQPANDLCSAAATVLGGQYVAGTNLFASSDIAQTCSSSDSIDVWYTFTAVEAGQHAVAATSHRFLLDTTVAVYTACGGTRLACNDDADPFYGTNSLVVLSLAAGQEVHIRVGGYDFGEGPFDLVVVPPPSPGATGACCMGSTCSVTPIDQCTGDGRRFAGSGSACNAAGTVSIPCCHADFDQNGFITITDLFSFLNGWLSADPFTQFNNSAGQTTQNILDFLAAWYNGC